MATVLTQIEADMLISMLKKAVEEEIEFPYAKGRVEFEVTGDRREDNFAINLSRKGYNATDATYQGRVKSSGIILMRLDVNPTSIHENPPGFSPVKFTGTHLHIYSEEYDMKVALPFDIGSDDLYQVCYMFFEKFNIIELPNIKHQLKLEIN